VILKSSLLESCHIMNELAWKLSSIGQLSILLEASSPKPGNVNRLYRFSDTGYRHFLASAALVNRGLYLAASKGIQLVEEKITPKKIGLGNIILECTKDVFTGINRRNTIFGTILLYVPLITSIAATIKKSAKFTVKEVQEWLKIILDQTTVQDTLDLYKAFHVVIPSNQLNKEVKSWTKVHERYDVSNPYVLENIRSDEIRLMQLFQLSADVDAISKEWANYFDLVLNEVVPYLDKHTESLEDLEEGAVRTFIWLLSKYPDGLIAKKTGSEQAERVRALAACVVEEGFEETEARILLEQLDTQLRKEGNLLNPGTTADLVSAAILCKLVSIAFNLK
jgi:triphosphoribosyl-dephospho-CoA synthase